MAGEYQVAGSAALYERYEDQEKVRIPGPIREDIIVYVSSYINFLSSLIDAYKNFSKNY